MLRPQALPLGLLGRRGARPKQRGYFFLELNDQLGLGQAGLEARILSAELGKLVEVGWVYTVVAGLLNVLAIYDAYEGPAYPDVEPAAPAASAGTVEGVNVGAGA